MKTTGALDRAISDEFLGRLSTEAAKGGWWTEVLGDRHLVVAVRGKSLDVYWRGQSIFHVTLGKVGLHATIHKKYLLDPSTSGRVPLLGTGDFALGDLPSSAFVRRFDPDALGKIKKAATFYSGLEKTGCHDIAVANDKVIDVEVAFPGRIVLRTGKETVSPRVDIASIEHLDEKHVRLVFWEAKHFSNGDLFARGEEVPVLDQIEGYRSYLTSGDHRRQIENCYTKVAANLIAISAMNWARPLSPLFDDIASGRKKLTLGDEPKVGLIVFGYSEGDRVHPSWQKHLKKLQAAGVDVKPKGDAKGIQL